MDTKSKYAAKITSFFTPDNIEFYNEQVDLDFLIRKLLENLALNYGIGNVQNIFTNFYKNPEAKKFPSALSSNYLLFHFRISIDDDPRIAIAISKKGIFNPGYDFSESVSIVIVITSPRDKPDIFLKIAKSSTEFFGNQKNIEFIMRQNRATDIWTFIDQAEVVLPEIIYVGDVMDKVKVCLNESNNLKDAIDRIVKTGYLNIPVVDLEGNLIGEVTSHELMEVCLPRYLLWMNDISPIVNFEPFQNMLEHEENTWLAEIMNYNYATIQKSDPFMQAAIVMTKKSSSHAYVLDDKKLVGVVSLQFFLDKILRE